MTMSQCLDRFCFLTYAAIEKYINENEEIFNISKENQEQKTE